VVFVTAFAENFDAVKEVTEVPCMTTTGYSPFQNAGGCGIIEGDPVPAVASAMVVRRLTPVECERLQGFPDNWTRIPYRNKGEADCPDGPRYKALGNSMAVPCMAWIGRRIQMVMEGKL
jgi:DNA (cytosine-5)-methyltransferase 1